MAGPVIKEKLLFVSSWYFTMTYGKSAPGTGLIFTSKLPFCKQVLSFCTEDLVGAHSQNFGRHHLAERAEQCAEQCCSRLNNLLLMLKNTGWL